MQLDDWQRAVLSTKGNIALRSGRQVGKSTIISIKAGEFAATHKNKNILIIASVERQAQLLFEKTMSYLFDNHKNMIKKGKDKPTKHKVTLINGSTIHCLPTGLSGYGIRGFTIDLLIADEAAFIPEEVWTAVTPMLAITKGSIILLSTPFGKDGFFYRCFEDPSFTTFHISSEECPRRDDDFLKKEKERMTKLQYAQEYLGEFVDELKQFFPSQLIRDCMTLNKESAVDSSKGKFYLGVDVARQGGDETVLFGVIKTRDGKLIQNLLKVYDDNLITETAKDIKVLNNKYGFSKIYIDDGGLGVGVFDLLLENPETKRKIEAVNNSARSLDVESKRKKKLLKEDLYNNLLTLMEQRKIELVNDERTFHSLKSVQSEYRDGRFRIFGKYTHIAEALIRAAWCVKDKTLNIWIAYK